MKDKPTTTLYDHYKNTPKKLKIICDWDEVIQACEPYALWKSTKESVNFAKTFFEYFWGDSCPVVYSHYGSRIESKINRDDKGCIRNAVGVAPKLSEKQKEIKNSPDFYQRAPFLTIAEDLLKLIKKNKVERLIFLSAYDKRRFPNGDDRKLNIVWNTFGMTPIAEQKKKKFLYN